LKTILYIKPRCPECNLGMNRDIFRRYNNIDNFNVTFKSGMLDDVCYTQPIDLEVINESKILLDNKDQNHHYILDRVNTNHDDKVIKGIEHSNKNKNL